MFNRKYVLKKLNAKRNSLKKRGASPSDMSELFGVGNTEVFGKMSNTQLKRISARVNEVGPVSVTKSGSVLPVEYLNRHKIWFGEDTRQPIAQNLKRAKDSGLYNHANKRDLKKEKQLFDNNAKNLYLEGLSQHPFLNDLRDELKNLSNRDFWGYIKYMEGLGDFEVFVHTDGNGNIVTDELNADITIELIHKMYDGLRQYKNRRT